MAKSVSTMIIRGHCNALIRMCVCVKQKEFRGIYHKQTEHETFGLEEKECFFSFFFFNLSSPKVKDC